MNSLIESYLSPTGDGGNLVSLDNILEKKIDQLPEKDRKDLASGSNKKSFNRVSKENKKEKDKVGKLNLARTTVFWTALAAALPWFTRTMSRQYRA